MLPEKLINDMCGTLKRDLNAPNNTKRTICNEEYKYKTRLLSKMCPELNQDSTIENYVKKQCANWCGFLGKKDVKRMTNWSWFIFLTIFIVGIVVYQYDPYNNWFCSH